MSIINPTYVDYTPTNEVREGVHSNHSVCLLLVHGHVQVCGVNYFHNYYVMELDNVPSA